MAKTLKSRHRPRRQALRENREPLKSYRLSFARGLDNFVSQELRRRLELPIVERPHNELTVRHDNPEALLQLKTVSSVFEELGFAVPRPKALLGDAQYRRIAAALARIQNSSQASKESFTGLRIEAAGKDSSTFSRLQQAIQHSTGLDAKPDGDLLLRVFPEAGEWKVLLRLTPRPLSSRP